MLPRTDLQRRALFSVLGLDDGKTPASISFNKAVTVFACFVLADFTALMTWFVMSTKTWPPAAIVGIILSFGIVIIGAGFGLKGYLGGINQKAIAAVATATDSTVLTGNVAEVIREIRARRDPAIGAEATP